MTTVEYRTYCAMCVAQCGVIASVEDGHFTRVRPDSEHPNGGLCIKGASAPQIVYSPDRLHTPLKRTRPKGDPDPGWLAISWEEALDIVTARLGGIKEQYGAEAVVFGRSTPAGSAASDFEPWVIRLASAFGTPNNLSTTHICTWNSVYGAKYTYGTPTPAPDYENTQCILLWGANPLATFPTAGARILRARKRGARLIVIDPRQHRLAREADWWLRVRPGADAALALGMTHVLIDEKLYDEAFVRDWTNGPFLIRDDTGRPLAARDLSSSGSPASFAVWDLARNVPVIHDIETGRVDPGITPALFGTFACRLVDGTRVPCRPAFARLAERAASHAPEQAEDTTWVPAETVRQAVRMFMTARPSCYFPWAGLEMHGNAAQTNRAISCFYALTGQFDQKGGNVLTATAPSRPIPGRELLSKEKAALRLGLGDHPLGPPNDPGIVQAGRVYDAILEGRPYKIRAMVMFGGDPLLGQGDTARGKQALEALDFYVHMDLFANASAAFADIVLPAASCWESEALKPNFGVKGTTQAASAWAQTRKAVVPPAGEARPDMAVMFDLAHRLGLAEHFFGGDVEAAWNYQLEPAGLTMEQLRAHPGGMAANVVTHHAKYAGIDPRTDQPRGFPTPSRKIELYSPAFANAGYDPLPVHDVPAETPRGGTPEPGDWPLVMTSYRLSRLINSTNRNIPRLREAAREPFVEIHPETADDFDIIDGEWVDIETPAGKVRLKVKFNGALHPKVVSTVYGWWQPCRELDLPGYDPLVSSGSNINLIIPNTRIDPISASVPLRPQMCRISKETS